MPRDSEWLNQNEKDLLNEILRVSKELRKKSLALNGAQFRLFEKAKKRAQFKWEFEQKFDGLDIYSLELSRRHKKKDTADMFQEAQK